MKKIIILLLGILIGGCVNQDKINSINELTPILERVANKHKCKLTYTVFLSDEKTYPLNLVLQSSLDYKATVGAIIEDCYLELAKKNIFYDRYTLKDSQGVLGMDISRKELERVLQCKPTAQRTIAALAGKQFLSVASELDTVYFKPDQIAKVQQYTEEKLHGQVREIGFEIAVDKGELYCAYAAFIDTTFVTATINLSKKNCKIFGLHS